MNACGSGNLLRGVHQCRHRDECSHRNLRWRLHRRCDECLLNDSAVFVRSRFELTMSAHRYAMCPVSSAWYGGHTCRLRSVGRHDCAAHLSARSQHRQDSRANAGGGSEIVLSIDLRFVSLERTVFGQPEVGASVLRWRSYRRGFNGVFLCTRCSWLFPLRVERLRGYLCRSGRMSQRERSERAQHTSTSTRFETSRAKTVAFAKTRHLGNTHTPINQM